MAFLALSNSFGAGRRFGDWYDNETLVTLGDVILKHPGMRGLQILGRFEMGVLIRS